MADRLNIICCLFKHKWTTYTLFDSHLIALILEYWSPTLPNTPFLWRLPHLAETMIIDQRLGRAWVIHDVIRQIAIYNLVKPQFQPIGKRGDVLVPIHQISFSRFAILDCIMDTNESCFYILAARRDNILDASIFCYCTWRFNLIRVTRTKLSNHILDSFDTQFTKSFDTFAICAKTSNHPNVSFIGFVSAKDRSVSLTSFSKVPLHFDIICSDGKDFYGFACEYQRVYNIQTLSCCSARLSINYCFDPTEFKYDRMKRRLVLKCTIYIWEFSLPHLQCEVISRNTPQIQLVRHTGSRLFKTQSLIHLSK